jgi:hypothetical protein
MTSIPETHLHAGMKRSLPSDRRLHSMFGAKKDSLN